MTIEDGDLFARYGLESNKIKKNKVNPKLFEPRKDGTLSVQTIDDLDRSQIETIGESIAKQNSKTLYGWAQITRSFVEEIKLSLCIDNNPRRGHATISGWPKERNARLDKQNLLAANCYAILCNIA